METKNIILKLRTERGLSQDELADKIMVTRQAVSQMSVISLRGKSLSGRIPSQIECCTGRIHRSRRKSLGKHLL